MKKKDLAHLVSKNLFISCFRFVCFGAIGFFLKKTHLYETSWGEEGNLQEETT